MSSGLLVIFLNEAARQPILIHRRKFGYNVFMSILLSGDFHANAVGELSLITKKSLTAKFGQKKFRKIDWHIILGDGGFLWPGNVKTDMFNYRTLALRPFPILCVIGNHEPMLGLNLPEKDIGIGETVYLVNDNPFVAYLKRGKIYHINGFKFLVLGGALSIDQEFRIPGRSWWKEEYWSAEEEANLYSLLDKNKDFDYVLSHTGPESINYKLFGKLYSVSDKFYDKVAVMNDSVDSRIDCRGWFCGHWHQDEAYYDADKKRSYEYLYKEVKLLENEANTI